MMTRCSLLGVVTGCLLLAACVAVAPPPARHGTEKVFVCHKGKTLEIAAPALDAHLRHGDTRGRCR